MATRQTLLTAVRRRIDEEDSTNSHFTNSEIYDYINQAIRYLGTDLEWPIQLAQATSVANQAVYTLPDDFISISDFYFNNRDLPIVDRSDLTALAGQWQDAPASTPQYAYRQDNSKIGLFPKPNSDNDGLAIQIWYIKVPPDLEDDVTAPDLHVSFHDCLPFYAAFLCEDKLGNTKKSNKELELYEYHKKRITSRVEKFADESRRFRWG